MRYFIVDKGECFELGELFDSFDGNEVVVAEIEGFYLLEFFGNGIYFIH